MEIRDEKVFKRWKTFRETVRTQKNEISKRKRKESKKAERFELNAK